DETTRLRVPDVHFPHSIFVPPVARRRREVFPVGTEGDVPDPFLVAEPTPLRLARWHLPETDPTVCAGRDERAAVGAECGDEHDGVGRVDGARLRAGLRIPDLHLAIVTGRDELPAAGAEVGGIDRPLMSPQREQLLAGLRIPDLGGEVVARRSES